MSTQYKPSLKIFISFDIVGSTNFKNSASEKDEEGRASWLRFFESFYADFTKVLTQEVENHPKLNDPPILWKSLGDELIYNKTISSFEEAYHLVQASKNAINEFTKEYIINTTLSKNQKINKLKSKLRVKGTSWLAGFPVINSRVKTRFDSDINIQDEKKENDYFDYIGPSIDTGFRLAKFSTENKFVLSLDLVRVIFEVERMPGITGGIYYETSEILKGVNNNNPYPIFYTPIDNELERTRRNLEGKDQCKSDDVINFFKAFTKSIEDPLVFIEPYITELTDGEYKIKQKLEDARELIQDHEKIIKQLNTTPQEVYSPEEKEDDKDSSKTKRSPKDSVVHKYD